MASAFFALLDDIATLMDDVAVTSKVAASKTAGILGDDLAVNAEKATGFNASRELPVLWAITKGSLLNKLMIVPVALALNVFFPIVIKYVLILGGIYLAFEGIEKIIEFIENKSKRTTDSPLVHALEDDDDKLAEKNKISSAIKTDFILSIEIVIMALGTVLTKSMPVQIITVSIVALLATFGVYGIVAMIVRMDDAGFKLIDKSNNKGIFSSVGKGLVNFLPYVIKILSVVGTIALLLVSGGIFSHNIDALHHLLPTWPVMEKDALLGIVAGTIAVVLFTIVHKIYNLIQKKSVEH
ncbi:DUF808 domain-containing protein [Chryseobacterium sp.]|uniref:DUF808 domain-containing protein n=1 Tax=Chryseobacterium sp. TaxID=1871047 RepID=UPI00388E8C40